MLTTEERKEIERLLLGERESAVEALRAFDQGRGESLQDEAGELGLYRFHLADIGTEAMEREKQFLLGSKEGERLYRIDEALRRLYQHPESFGVCSRCGRQIAWERLTMVPATAHCADCARALEG